MIDVWLDPATRSLIVDGIILTLLMTVVTSVAALLGGIAAGAMQLSRHRWLAAVGRMHVTIHRNVPALVLVLFWAFAIPNLFPAPMRRDLFFQNELIRTLSDVSGLPLVYYAIALCLALSLNGSAYIAEQFRAGVSTIAVETVDTARSLGATRSVVFWTILLPQGLAAAFPAIATRLIHTMKNTSLATFVAVPDLFHQTQAAATRTFHAVEYLLLAALLYLILTAAYGTLLARFEALLVRHASPHTAIRGSVAL